MRLIDADALIEQLSAESRLTYLVKGAIDNQPTAYDLEKVVEQLDNASFLMEPRTEGHYADNGVFLDEAIKIVRKGGAE